MTTFLTTVFVVCLLLWGGARMMTWDSPRHRTPARRPGRRRHRPHRLEAGDYPHLRDHRRATRRADITRPRARITSTSALVSVLAGVATACTGGSLLAQSWAACVLARGLIAAAYIFCAHMPAMTTLATVWWLFVHKIAARTATPGRGRTVGVTVAGCVGSAVLIWVYLAWKNVPGGGYLPLFCSPGNIAL
ncbi:hypothetical protein [Nocardia jiangsuensis]|uniref:Uncharacterized protein n=1 Tax=Nocardia jiangsuensis TaxID=1691563 RepID=A0ABV8DQE9_9NOCA